MRDPVNEFRNGGSAAPSAAPSADPGPTAQKPGAELQSLLRPFLDQHFPIRSLLVVGVDAVGGEGPVDALLFKVAPDQSLAPGTPLACAPARPVTSGEWPGALESLRRQAEELCDESAGDDLLVAPADILEAATNPLAATFGFRAVAALMPTDDPNEADRWRLGRDLFDRGLVGNGAVPVGAQMARCFLASDAVRSPNRLDAGTRGQVIMSTLGQSGRFGNQLFQYAFVKLYALRHGLAAAVPDWEGRGLYDLRDAFSAGITLPQITFKSFTLEDLRLWENSNPPIDVDFWGYFQEVSERWRPHRSLLRTLFALPTEQQESIDAWHNDLTKGGERTLVAVHVRRGDYRNADIPRFRVVPEVWHLAWLRDIWPTLREPVLFVATDEPDAILPSFEEFDPVSVADWPAAQLPEHIRDFEVLRRADYLALSNSSFSRMAAILAPAGQRSFIASFEEQRFVPYEPWIDPGFWARFAEPSPALLDGDDQPKATGTDKDAPAKTRPTIFFDITDLLLYLLDHPTLSGIQRVQCEIVRNLLEPPQLEPVHFTIFKDGALAELEASSLLDVIDRGRSVAAVGSDLQRQVRLLSERARPRTAQPGDLFLTTGAFWAANGLSRFMQELKNSRVVIGMYVHDMIPIAHPEYCHGPTAKAFVKTVTEALNFADFILTSSEYNKTSIVRHRTARRLRSIPIDVVPLAHELSKSTSPASEISDSVAGLVGTEFVLCVGTIEVRKNPNYLFNIWRLMVQSGRQNVPTLVFAGRNGWLVKDFIDQLEGCNNLRGRIVLLHNLSDAELDVLYRNCLLTMFPSFVEGWGLPVGESLAYGKVCIASVAGGIPEVGGTFVDYVDPYNTRSGLEQLLRYLDDPGLRQRREAEIAEHFRMRRWQQFTFELLKSTFAFLRERRGFEGTMAVALPSNTFLPVNSNPAGTLQDGVDGSLSAELACVSGWQQPKPDGARAEGPTSVVRFRADVAAGSKINLILRLATSSPEGCRLRIATGSGASTLVTLSDNAEKLAILPCEVERESLVTASLSLVREGEDRGGELPAWRLCGILYVEPGDLVNQTLAGTLRKPKPSSTITFAEQLAFAPAPDQSEGPSPQDQIKVVPAPQSDEGHRVATRADFLQTPDSCWPVASGFSIKRDAPIFVDRGDKQLFYSRYRASETTQTARVRRLSRPHDDPSAQQSIRLNDPTY